jgi:hypothetical protein
VVHFSLSFDRGSVVVSSRSAPHPQELLRRFDRSKDIFAGVGSIKPSLSSFSFQSVKTAGTSAQLTWTPVDSDARYLVFSQETYGVYFTKENRFQFVDLEPGKTYHVFVLAINLGPEYIAFTAFETSQ